MEDIEESYEDQLVEVVRRIENFKNPATLEIKVNVDENDRNKFYNTKMHQMTPKQIIQTFEKCSNLDGSEHDFGRMNENHIKERINKLGRMKIYFEKKIEEEKSKSNSKSNSNSK